MRSDKLTKFPYQIGVGSIKIGARDRQYIKRVLDSGRLSYGPFLKRFETEFARVHGVRFAVAVNSGTSALEIAVACLKEVHHWRDGDEVLCPAVTFVASSNVILQNNLRPVFVDVDAKTYNIDPAKIEAKITARTRAIMPVHLFGQPAEMDKVMRIARKHKLRIIEDSCETMFAKFNGRSVGSFGDIACFSTYVAHILVTGVGGLVLTDSPQYAEILRSLANHGRDSIYISIDDDKGAGGKRLKEIVARRFRFVRRGYSYRITELEGAIGCAQFERRASILRTRRQNAAFFTKRLLRFSDLLQLPERKKGADHVYMMYPIVVQKDAGFSKQELVNYLEELNIETRDMMPLINQPLYEKLYGKLESKYPVARWINRNGFYIGCHQFLTSKERSFIVSAFEHFFNSNGKAQI